MQFLLWKLQNAADFFISIIHQNRKKVPNKFLILSWIFLRSLIKESIISFPFKIVRTEFSKITISLISLSEKWLETYLTYSVRPRGSFSGLLEVITVLSLEIFLKVGRGAGFVLLYSIWSFTLTLDWTTVFPIELRCCWLPSFFWICDVTRLPYPPLLLEFTYEEYKKIQSNYVG